ncbi:MAG: type VI secretion system contractile sheath large subunit, partial [Phycisphaerales bacterium]
LPSHTFKADDGGISQKCPTEIAITERREKELSDLGFFPLSHYKYTDYAVFFGGQTVKKPKLYEGKDGDMATANEAIMCRLPYNIAAGRISHYLKMIARDKVGSFMEVEDCQEWLNGWISNYVLADTKAKQDMKAKFPLAEANIAVEPIPGKPGAYHAVAHLRPWLQMEELRASIRMVSEIPSGK